MKKIIVTTLTVITVCFIFFGAIGLSEAGAINPEKITEEMKRVETTVEKCKHLETFNRTIPSNCKEVGISENVCEECFEILNTETISVTEHKFKTNILKKATCSQCGEKNSICEICGFETEVETLDKTEHIIREEIVENATCYKSGTIREICDNCNVVISTNEIPKLSHNFEVISEVSATPLQTGLITYSCIYCNNIKEVIQEKITMRDLYIPSVGINVDVHFGECSQYNTDTYDVNCDYLVLGKKHPVISGHNYNTLGLIYGIEEGDLIYFNKDGEIITYKVTVSDAGIDTICEWGWASNIVSINTGKKCLYYSDNDTIHMFTCYYDSQYGNCRWMVVGEKI